MGRETWSKKEGENYDGNSIDILVGTGCVVGGVRFCVVSIYDHEKTG